MTALAFAVSRRASHAAYKLKSSPRRADRGAHRRGRAPGARERLGRERARNESCELRSCVGASAAIAVAFVLALAYLAGSTGVASVGYEAQRLQGQRDELRRQNALLELELARLDAPARIEAEARRLGLVRVAYIPVVPADPLAARR